MIIKRLLTYDGDEGWIKRTLKKSLINGIDGEIKIGTVPNRTISSKLITEEKMTPESAREELKRRFPNCSVLAEISCWYHSIRIGQVSTYSIAYTFSPKDCTSKESSISFEDCFSQLDKEVGEINRVIKEKGILFRKF